MGVIIETQTDAFASNLLDPANTYTPPQLVRRPFRGFEIKDDTYATLRVITADGGTIPLVDSGGPLSPVGPEGAALNNNGSGSGPIPTRVGRRMMASTPIYSNFIIQSIKDSRQEKAQFMETFGDTYVFFFGERPRIITVQGLLFNTLDFNWRTEFWYNYENYLRGTKLVEMNARVYLQWDDLVVEGYMLGADADDNSEMPYHIPFTFQLFVTNHAYLSPYLGDPVYPVRATKDGVLEGLISQSLTVSNTAGKMKDFTADAAFVQSSLKVGKYMLAGAGLATSGAVLNRILGRTSGTNTNPTMAKRMVLDLVKAGLIAQSATFLNVLARYFKSSIAPTQQRNSLARATILDNRDEYVGGEYADAVYDRAAATAADVRVKAIQTVYQVESILMAQLQAMDVNATQLDEPDDGVSPMSQAHRFQYCATPAGVSSQKLIQGLK